MASADGRAPDGKETAPATWLLAVKKACIVFAGAHATKSMSPATFSAIQVGSDDGAVSPTIAPVAVSITEIDGGVPAPGLPRLATKRRVPLELIAIENATGGMPMLAMAALVEPS